MIALEEAQVRILALVAPLPPEMVPLVEAVGRWAAERVVARRAQPSADLSAMDGYAIRHADLPGPWCVVDEIPAGGRPRNAIASGEATRIFTGAPLPPGADAILIQEDARRGGDTLTLTGDGPASPSAHVRPAGMDFREGATLIDAGERLTPARIALAAIGGHGALAVRRRVRVALISTGDELVAPGESGGLPASNAPMLSALLSDLPCEIADLGIVRDDLAALTVALEDARDYDLVVTTGGASVGDHDLVRPALLAAGANIDFWKVAMRPGKPLMAGRLGNAVVIGLPGNPVSAFVTALLFVRPLIAHLSGARDAMPPRIAAMLASPLPAVGARTDFVRAAWRNGHLTPLGESDSAALVPFAGAEALIVRAAGAPPAEKGEIVEAIALA